MTNEEKARDLCMAIEPPYIDFIQQNYKTALKAMEWKDEQFAKEKQQIINNAVEWLNKYLFYLDKKDDIINNFKQSVKGE